MNLAHDMSTEIHTFLMLVENLVPIRLPLARDPRTPRLRPSYQLICRLVEYMVRCLLSDRGIRRPERCKWGTLDRSSSLLSSN